MQMYKNEIQVQQGEDFNLDIIVSASNIEHIPFLVSSQRSNPHFVCTVASTKFEKNLRYVKSWWSPVVIDLPPVKGVNANNQEILISGLKFPTFYSTIPVECGELASGTQLPIKPGEGAFKEFTINDTTETRYLYQYTKEGDDINYSLGHKPYYYFYFNYVDGQLAQYPRIDEYDCKITFNFNTEITQKWSGQNYMYQITLVSGTEMETYLEQVHKYYSEQIGDEWPKTQDEQYKYVKLMFPTALQNDIDIDSPLGRIEQPIPILRPTKLEVLNNLRILI